MAQKLGFLPTLPSLLAEPGSPFIHRDLSWLQFNERVLNEARDSSNPLLERLKFLAISQSNLDEFFMIRFSSLTRSVSSQVKSNPERAERTIEIRDNILESVAQFTGRQADTLESLAYELENAGIHLIRGANEGEPAYVIGEKVFREQILPSLTVPTPFNFNEMIELENLQTAIVFKGDRWVKLGKALPGVYLAAANAEGSELVYAFFLDDLIMTHLENTFEPIGLLRLTKDGDFSVDLEEEDPENIPDVIRTGIGRREKGKAVRLQYLGSFEDAFLTQCLNTLKLQPGQLMIAPGSLFFQSLWTLVNQCPESVLKARPNLKHPPLPSRMPRLFDRPEEIFATIRREDILLHHPYDSFDAFVRFLQAACDDPQVRSIEMTVYRMDAISPVIDALKNAAKTKRVRAMIELRARFDELNNLRLADELKKAGVEVHFGFGKLKLHAKIVLITRGEKNVKGEPTEVLYTHISTGNYNAATARLYTDLAVLTSRNEVGQDARLFFDAVVQEQVPANFKHLVAAPTRLHRRLIAHIDQEAAAAKLGHKARIVAKVNALVDNEVVEKLYQASQAGVQIDLIVRGACSLIPGIQGLSENIRVISVVDRFLEHSRIYYFENARALYLCSADWMPRNFFSRLEIAFKVTDPLVYRYLEEFLIPIYLSDAVKSRELTPLGTWKKRTVASAKAHFSPALKTLFKGLPLRSQFLFEELARREYAGTPLVERMNPS